VGRVSANVSLLRSDLIRFVETLAHARDHLAVLGLGIGLAAFGVLGPLMASFNRGSGSRRELWVAAS
jgi:hypothetical protein